MTSLSTPHRVAVYFAPAVDHPLWAAGCAWLGRDARAGLPLPAPARPHVRAPWRYGFHATMKAPLRLADGRDLAGFLAEVAGLAARHARFDVPPLRVTTLNDFLALRPAGAVPAGHPLRRLADACVTDLDEWRAPLTEAERLRQAPPHASLRQHENVRRYGYGHVLDDWRFHLTLTDGLHAAEADARDALTREALRHFAPALQVPLAFEDLAVFVEPAAGEPFVLVRRFPLGAS